MTGEQQIQVVIGVFDSVDGAVFALGRVQTSQVRLHNHAILERAAHGGLQVRDAGDTGLGKGAFVGAVASLLIPGVGLIGGAVVGGLVAKLRDAGFPNQQLRRLGKGLSPSSSALILLIDPPAVDSIRGIIENVGGRVAVGSVDAELVLPVKDKQAGTTDGTSSTRGE